MEISNMHKKLRYFSYPHLLYSLLSQSPPSPSLSTLPKTLISPRPSFPNTISHSNRTPTSHPLYSSISSSGLPSVCSITSPFSQSLHCYGCIGYQRSLILNLTLLRPKTKSLLRLFSVSTFDISSTSASLGHVVSNENCEFKDLSIDGFGGNASPKQVSEIIEVIKRGESDLEMKLNLMDVNLSVGAITEIFRVLNCERVSALRFFDWIKDFRPNLHCDSDICSLIIENCGWLDDYKGMMCLLKDFKLKQVCLTKKAFGFLPIFSSSKASIMDCIRRQIQVLDEVGGSCRSTGIRGLIEMFSGLGFFEMAKFVMEITERKPLYYTILIREKCLRFDFKEARDMLEEMRQLGCDPDAKSYNYLLSSLSKNDKAAEVYSVLTEMQEKGCPPDAITFEILIFYTIRLGKLDFAVDLLDQMESRGIEPRFETHAAFIKGYFYSGKYEEAYNYVVGSVAKYKSSSNMIYSLLVSLHQEKGNLVIAQNIIVEMINKGLKPNFPVCMRVLKRLRKSRRVHLARDLSSRLSRLRLEPSTEAG
ncbi:hypothetical protein L1049_026321 [Liquidambar formosana]|uniref:Pentatricopeptide repeat-containing protein n=1 Tax=Liquidambar formosana TaxID=63359 RepID=A0AAP0ND52_LIQFO